MKSITTNYLYNVVYQIVTLLTPFLVTPYLSRVLEADGIGIYSYVSSVVAYFILAASLGIAMYAQREVSYYRDDKRVMTRVFYEVQIFHALLVLVSLTAYYVFISHVDSNHDIYWIQALNIVAVFFDISWFFFGLEEFPKIVIRNFIIKILNVISVFIFIHKADDLILYTFLMAALNILSGLIMWIQLPPYLVRIKWSMINPFRNFKIIIQMFLPQIVGSIYLVMDKTMLGVLGGSDFENGYYEYAERIAKLPIALLTSLGTVMMPRLAYAYSKGDFTVIRDYMERANRFTWFMSVPVCFGLMGIASNFVPWFFGAGYETIIPLIWILSGITICISFSCLFGPQYMIPTGQQNFCTLANACGAIVNLVLNFILIPQLLSIGTAIATLLAELSVTIALSFFLRKQLPVWKYLKMSFRYLGAGCIMLIILVLFSNNLQSGIIQTFTLIFIGGTIYLGILYILHDEMLVIVWNKIKEKLDF